MPLPIIPSPIKPTRIAILRSCCDVPARSVAADRRARKGGADAAPLASASRDDNALDAGEIGDRRLDPQTVRGENPPYSVGLSHPDFGGEETTRRQQAGQIGGDRAIGSQPVG